MEKNPAQESYSMYAYAVGPDGESRFAAHADRLGIRVTTHAEGPRTYNAANARGYDCVSVLSGAPVTAEILDTWHSVGVRALVTRTVGFEHIDLEHARAIGMPVCAITYSASAVADFAIMLMLMVTRRVKEMQRLYQAQNFTMGSLVGRELPNLTVGVVGLGAIGSTVVRHLQGFGCRVLAYDRREHAELAGLCTQVGLDELLAASDIVSLHLACNEQTEHIMDARRIAAMKPGAVLVNTARGPLVDTEALVAALESGALAGAGLDVFEGDRPVYYRDYTGKPVPSHLKAVLDSLPTVVMTPHMAYNTDQVLDDMVRNSLIAAREVLQSGQSTFRVA